MMRRLFYTAATVDAATLHQFGSVHEVVPAPNSTRLRCGSPATSPPRTPG